MKPVEVSNQVRDLFEAYLEQNGHRKIYASDIESFCHAGQGI